MVQKFIGGVKQRTRGRILCLSRGPRFISLDGMIMYRLIIEEPGGRKRSVAVQEGAVALGRDPSCDVQLMDDEVSWKHAMIETGPDGLRIRDMGSLNKITLNGADVREARLADGDRIELGRTRILFQDARAAVQPAGRRVSLLHRITLTAVALVLLIELVLVTALFIWRHTGGDELLAAESFDTAESSEKPAEPPQKPVEVAKVEPEPAAVTTDRVPETPEPKPDPVPDRLTDVEWITPPVAEAVPEKPEVPAPAEEPEPEPDTHVELESEPAPAVPDRDEQIEPAAEPLEPASAPDKEIVPEPEPVPETIPEPVKEKPEEEIQTPAEKPKSVEPAAPEDPLITLARNMLREARTDIAKMNYTEADSRLERIEIVAPDYLPAYEERAKLYESRGMLQQAGEQWAEVMRRSQGKPDYARAAAERSRLAQKTSAPGVITAPRRIAALSAPDKPLPKRVMIQSVDMDEFGPGPEFDEMRLLRIRLRPKASEKNIEGGEVAVNVSFYERDRRTRTVQPAEAYVPGSIVLPGGIWSSGGIYEAQATYLVSRALGSTGSDMSYYGYVIQVFYQDVLQDERISPPALKDYLTGN